MPTHVPSTPLSCVAMTAEVRAPIWLAISTFFAKPTQKSFAPLLNMARVSRR